MPAAIFSAYQQRVAKSHFQRDAAQEAAARRLDLLCDELAQWRRASKAGALGWLFQARETRAPPRGFYIWGGVGRGKTMLMDLFFDHAPVAAKRRVHFHAFMQDAHARIHAWRQAHKRGEVSGDDPIAPVAAAMAAESWLLCFDEFSVTDIADAMILGRLFRALFAQGVILVATSNVAPDDLYRDGLNRTLFLPFIALLSQHVQVLRLDAARDFRLERLSEENVWRVPADPAARAALDKAFAALGAGEPPRPLDLPVLGRMVRVPLAAAGVARFTFAELCEAPLGAPDYLALAQRFHTMILDEVPVIAADARNAAKRFITLIDALYDRHVKLLASAAAAPDATYLAQDGREAFEFARTASRLAEMASLDYLAQPHGRPHSHASGQVSGLVET